MPKIVAGKFGATDGNEHPPNLKFLITGIPIPWGLSPLEYGSVAITSGPVISCSAFQFGTY